MTACSATGLGKNRRLSCGPADPPISDGQHHTARTKGNILHIPLHPSLISILSEIPVSERKEYVLPGFADQYRTNDSDVAKKLRRYFESCGIRAHKENTGKGTDKRAVVEVGFHSLRHSFVSLCRSANAPLAVVESIVGHSNPAMTRHYTHVSELAAGQAVAALPALGESEKSGKETRPPENTIPELSAILPELQRMNAKNWRKIRNDLVEMLNSKTGCPHRLTIMKIS